LASKAVSPSIAVSSAATSVLVKTDGMRLGRVGRCISVNQGKLVPSTSRYKNNKALRAWLWVETETRRSLANMLKNAVTSAAPTSRGCRITPARPHHRTKNRTQYR